MIGPAPKRRSSSNRHLKAAKKSPGESFALDPELAVAESLRRAIGFYYENNIAQAAKAIEMGEFPQEVLKPYYSLIEQGQTFRINAEIFTALQNTLDKYHS